MADPKGKSPSSKGVPGLDEPTGPVSEHEVDELVDEMFDGWEPTGAFKVGEVDLVDKRAPRTSLTSLPDPEITPPNRHGAAPEGSPAAASGGEWPTPPPPQGWDPASTPQPGQDAGFFPSPARARRISVADPFGADQGRKRGPNLAGAAPPAPPAPSVIPGPVADPPPQEFAPMGELYSMPVPSPDQVQAWQEPQQSWAPDPQMAAAAAWTPPPQVAPPPPLSWPRLAGVYLLSTVVGLLGLMAVEKVTLGDSAAHPSTREVLTPQRPPGEEAPEPGKAQGCEREGYYTRNEALFHPWRFTLTSGEVVKGKLTAARDCTLFVQLESGEERKLLLTDVMDAEE